MKNLGTDGPRQVRGARGPIHIAEDDYGIPHVTAGSLHDAYFAQGYICARDRLTQMDFDRRREMGQLAQVFGPEFAAADAAVRAFHYRGDIAAELAGIPDNVRECAEGYVAGVNARYDEIEADPSLMSPEYAALGIRPLRWTLEDFVRMRGAGSGVEDEIRRAMLAARDMLELDHYMDPLRPAHNFTVPEGLDTQAVSMADLGLLTDTGKLPFNEALVPTDAKQQRADRAAQGSNAWTIDARHTTTGRPILANDPHLSIGGASPRHICHLSAPGLNVIGAGYPGLPGIMQGHTDRFAFGRTNFHIDQSDLFILELNPENPEQWRHKGVWRDFERFEDSIPVKDAPDQNAVLRHALGRPVIAYDPARNRAVAMATVSMLPGANMQFAILAINLAHDWDSLREACRLHPSPTNLHYADIDGNTGWHAIGYAPKRPRHDGLFPVPGNGDYDWDGLLTLDEMPSVYNPPSGVFVSANALNIPASYPLKERVLSFHWNDPYRQDRIEAVLGAPAKHSIEQSVALQHDVQSLPARALLALLPDVEGDAAPARDMLARWDCNVTADSGAALLYEMVITALLDGFREAVIPDDARDLITSIDLEEMLTCLAQPDPRLGSDPAAARDALIEAALIAGWHQAVQAAGPDPQAWAWGDLHHVVIRPELHQIPQVAAAVPEISGGRSGGDAYTVCARAFSASDEYRVRHGASYLMVADVGNWDNTRFLLLPGQSADPRSPHFKDFYQPWLAGREGLLPFSMKAVAKRTITRWSLVPGTDA